MAARTYEKLRYYTHEKFGELAFRSTVLEITSESKETYGQVVYQKSTIVSVEGNLTEDEAKSIMQELNFVLGGY